MRPTAVSSVHVFDDEDFVAPPDNAEDDITYHNYTIWLSENAPKLKPCEDKVLQVLLPSNKERKKFFQTYGSLCSCWPPPIGMFILCRGQM